MHSNTHTLLTVIMIINNDNNHITSYTYIYIFYIWLYLFLSVVWKKANLYQRYPLSIAICWEFDCSKSRPWWQSTAPRDMKVWILTSPGPTNWRGELSELLVIAIVFRVKLGFPSTNWSWYNIYIYIAIYIIYISWVIWTRSLMTLWFRDPNFLSIASMQQCNDRTYRLIGKGCALRGGVCVNNIFPWDYIAIFDVRKMSGLIYIPLVALCFIHSILSLQGSCYVLLNFSIKATPSAHYSAFISNGWNSGVLQGCLI